MSFLVLSNRLIDKIKESNLTIRYVVRSRTGAIHKWILAQFSQSLCCICSSILF